MQKQRRNGIGDDILELALIVAREVAVMFLFIVTGVICKKAGIIGEETARSISNLLLMVVVPAMLIRAMQMERDPALLPGMGAFLALTIAAHLISILLANLMVRDPKDGTTAWRVTKLAVVFSNAGFMGFPLLQATVGDIGPLYGAVFLGVFNVVSWMWCVPVLTGGKGLPLKKLITTPAVLAFLAGIALFLLGIRLPGPIYDFLDGLSKINTPLSMLVIGVYLASVNVREAVRDKRVYQLIGMRNLLIPALTLGLLPLLWLPSWLPDGKVVALSFLILMACPSAANTILMSARYRCDGGHGSKLVAASTAVSILTLPLFTMLGSALF